MTAKKLISSKRSRSRGYSMIEVLMGMAVLAVGASGVLALQKVTVLGVTMGRNVNAAAAVAAAHLEAVRADAIRWNSLTDYGEAALMNSILAGNTVMPAATPWVLATVGNGVTDDLGFGLSDVTGQTAGTAADRPPIAYCTHMRLTPLEFDSTVVTPTPQSSQSILMRLEVRTFWAKSGRDVNQECTDDGVAEITTGLAGGEMAFDPPRTADEYGWVFLATAIRRNDIIVNN